MHDLSETTVRRSGPRRGSRFGFSVVELIVVVSIIATLLGLLLPVLSGVRSAGRGALCQSNLRQMSIAAEAYATKYRAYPAALRYDNSGGVFKQVAWDWVKTINGDIISPGPLWQFTGNPDRVMQCPEYLGSNASSGDPFTGFNYSTYIGGEEPFNTSPSWSKVRDGASPFQIRRPGQTAMFGLGGYKGGTNKYMRSPLHQQHSEILLQLSAIYAGGQAFRYRGSTFVAYADGRVGSSEQPREGELATDALLEQYLDFPRNGFLTDDAFAYKPF
jgi:type II secretory pathway pseudopilin PulG